MSGSELFRMRVATREDTGGLHRLIERSVRGLQREDYSEAQREGALGHALGLDTRLIEDGTYFVAYPEEQPVVLAGCGGWSFRRTLFGSDGGPQRSGERMEAAAEAAKIRAIFVDPAFARRGLGSLILEHCEEAARTAGFRRFEMGSTLTGVPLYRLRGYVESERVEVPLPNGEVLPIVKMWKG